MLLVLVEKVCGLSPRGSGNRATKVRARGGGYPCAGGAIVSGLTAPFAGLGLSPRGRGNPDKPYGGAKKPGSVPAWAGQSPSIAECFRRAAVYPRVGGAIILLHPAGGKAMGLSPRGRGNLAAYEVVSPETRSIPAWAGQSSLQPKSKAAREVYPRVGGAIQWTETPQGILWGLSPRGRGNPAVRRQSPRCPGSIPAWAGQSRWPAGIPPRHAVYPRVGGVI